MHYDLQISILQEIKMQLIIITNSDYPNKLQEDDDDCKAISNY